MEENTGTSVADSSSNSNTLSFDGNPSWTTASPPSTYSSSYLTFDGDDRLTASYDASLAPASEISIVFWVQRNANSVDYGILGFGSRNSNGYMLRWYSDNKLYLYLWGATTDAFNNAASPILSDTDWVHLVVTYKGNDVVKMYKDGSAVSVSSSLNGDGDIQYNGDETLYLGFNETGNGGYLSGEMDETAIFSSILDSTDANDIFTNGLYEAATARRFFLIQ